ncbi:enolase C-terminal domain-like protein [Sphaerochaeta sp. S2]|uniref:enolase C-terminal domain-like protein n=1 Tax=Sphaerochaeta sp. S2 TaxID=2798868 RepID=UPI0018E998C2|nr:enolase C-terminal domain-like protein [Sphaerochaeta sp. S2]MBJ2357675.1 L-alanine-DL-glutamate epimerase [Sphaerochaeta sp. S2]
MDEVTIGFPIEDQELSFSKAVFYNFNPIPVKKPWRDATGGFGSYIPLQGWIQLFDNDGFCGETFCSMGMVENILPLVLTGEKKKVSDWYQYLYWKLRNFGFQSGQIADLGQFDFLMLDILARKHSLPLHRYLGAKKDWCSIYKGGGSLLSSDADLVTDMERYVKEGNKIIKFKVGSDWGQNMKRDVLRMAKVRDAVGPDVHIAIDANQVFSVDEALRFADLIRPYNPAWYEEPCHSHDMNGIKELKERGVGLKLGYGESMRNAYAFETYAEKGVDHLMPLVGRMCKMSDLLKIRALCKERKLLFSAGGTSWLNAAFGALFDEDEYLENHEPMTDPIGDILSVKSEEKNGRFYLPDIIGTPIRINFEKIEKNHILDGVKCYYAERMKASFAVRAAY